MSAAVTWPDGKRFAFTIFDDPDGQSFEDSRLVYSFLSDLGFRTTIGVWPVAPPREPNSGGETCADPAYRAWIQELQRRGFDPALHNGAPTTLVREEIVEALDRFREYFGGDPLTMANHYNGDAIYWGPARLTGSRRLVYTLATRGATRNRHFGEVEGHPSFWGDLCRERVRYCRNFVFSDINTLGACPWMPYHDPARPYVRGWFASTEGSKGPAFLDRVTERELDRLEEEGGACIMYTHFGHGFVDSGRLEPRFRRIMEHLARRDGWFVPVGTLLEHLRSGRPEHTLTPDQRASLERRWLWLKLRHGTS